MVDEFDEEDATKYCPWGRRVFLKLRSLRPRGSIRWLAPKIHFGHATLSSAMAGKGKPPIEAIGELREILGLREREAKDVFNEMIGEYTIRNLESQFGTFKPKHRLIVYKMATELGDELYKDTQDLNVLLCIPLIMHQLAPFRFRHGRLLLTHTAASNITITPPFGVPTSGMPFMATGERGVHFGPIDIATADIESVQDAFGLAHDARDTLAKDLTSNLPGTFLRHPVGHNYICYRSREGETARAIATGTVLGIDKGDHVVGSEQWETNIVVVSLGAGYVVEYCDLTEVRVSLGEEVHNGTPIGRTAKVGYDEHQYVGERGNIAVQLEPVYGVSVNVGLLATGDEPFVQPKAFLDARMLVPGNISPRARIGMNVETLEQLAELSLWKQEHLQTMTLLEVGKAGQGDGLWLQRTTGSYMVIPDNKVLAEVSMGLLVLIEMAFWLLRALRARRPKQNS